MRQSINLQMKNKRSPNLTVTCLSTIIFSRIDMRLDYVQYLGTSRSARATTRYNVSVFSIGNLTITTRPASAPPPKAPTSKLSKKRKVWNVFVRFVNVWQEVRIRLYHNRLVFRDQRSQRYYKARLCWIMFNRLNRKITLPSQRTTMILMHLTSKIQVLSTVIVTHTSVGVQNTATAIRRTMIGKWWSVRSVSDGITITASWVALSRTCDIPIHCALRAMMRRRHFRMGPPSTTVGDARLVMMALYLLHQSHSRYLRSSSIDVILTYTWPWNEQVYSSRHLKCLAVIVHLEVRQ